ncbi:MAG: hypothetical protein NT027_14820 [Proteobacteria bacterium]|nr:hypothetical protein [Pseudomonadota bacterium]
MVPKWFKNRRSSLSDALSQEGPSINAYQHSPSIKNALGHGHLSVFQSKQRTKDKVLFLRHNQSNSTYFSIISFDSTSAPLRHSFNTVAEQKWIEMFSVSDFESTGLVTSNEDCPIMFKFISTVKGSIDPYLDKQVDISHVCFTFSKLKLNTLIRLQNGFTGAQIFSNGEVVCLQNNQSYQMDLSGVKAIMFIKGSIAFNQLTETIKKLLQNPYPVAGAAELIHFKLKQFGLNRDVYWFELE